MTAVHEAQYTHPPGQVGQEPIPLDPQNALPGVFPSPAGAATSQATEPADPHRTEGYRLSREDTGRTADERLDRVAIGMRLMLGVPVQNLPESAVRGARWRDKYLVADVIREADPRVQFSRFQRLCICISS